jgi:hypothetical protein
MSQWELITLTHQTATRFAELMQDVENLDATTFTPDQLAALRNAQDLVARANGELLRNFPI